MKSSIRRKVSMPSVGDAEQRHRNIVFAICKGGDSPRALGMWLRYKYREFKQLVEIEVKPSDYCFADVQGFTTDYQISEYLSKYKGFDTGVDLKDTALLSFTAAESKCQATNTYLKTAGRRNASLQAVMLMAQRKISDLLGACPSYFDFSDGMWGPGVTATLTGEHATLAQKLLEKQISVSSTSMQYLRAELGRDIFWAQARGIPAEAVFSPLQSEFELVNYCKITTVPKNAKTDRVIAIEPTGNIFLQKAVGAYVRRCLRTVGIDLNDQSVNQRLAFEGSKTLQLATVDLKAASDTVSYELVAQLLPYDWFCLLDRLRSRYYKLGKSIGRFEKFSTMGNGFTFELESLIFWAITQSTVDAMSMGNHGRCMVYGDDIVCPTISVPHVLVNLGLCGFTPNTKKTHFDSPFRESCGKHYWGGIDVSPIYQKETLATYEECIAASNRIHRQAFRTDTNSTDSKSIPLRSAWLASIHGIDFVDFVPLDCEEDTGLAVRLADLPATIPPHGGLLVRHLRRRAVSRHVHNSESARLALWYRLRGPRDADSEYAPSNLFPDASSVRLKVTNLRRRYSVSRKLHWYPGATELGFSLKT